MKKKILTLTFTLILLIGLVAAVGMNASAASEVVNPVFKEQETDYIQSLVFVPNGDGTYNVSVKVDISQTDPQEIQHNLVSIGYVYYDANNAIHYGIYGNNYQKDDPPMTFTINNAIKNVKPGDTVKIKVYLADDPYADEEWRDYYFPWVQAKAPTTDAYVGADDYIYYVSNADDLRLYLSRAEDGDTIRLSDDIVFQNASGNFEIEPMFMSSKGGNVILDLNGCGLYVAASNNYLFDMCEATGVSLHIVNSDPEYIVNSDPQSEGWIQFVSPQAGSSVFYLGSSNNKLYIYEGVSVTMGKANTAVTGSQATYIINASSYAEIGIHGAYLQNLYTSGEGLYFNNNSKAMRSSKVYIDGGTEIKTNSSCIDLNNSPYYPDFRIGAAILDGNNAIEVIDDNQYADTTEMALKFKDLLQDGYNLYMVDGTGSDYMNNATLSGNNDTADCHIYKPGYSNPCSTHANKKDIFVHAGGHLTQCIDCGYSAGTTLHTQVTVKEATCTSKGYSKAGYDCACGRLTATVIPALGHDIITVEAKEPTCTEDGSTSDYKKCTRCNAKYGINGAPMMPGYWNSMYKKALGHDMVKVDAKAATCTAKGNIAHYDCSRCDHKSSDAEGKNAITNIVAPKTGHKEVKLPAVAATYKADGKTEGKKCTACGEITVAQQTVAKKVLGKVTGLKTKAVKLASGTKTTLTLAWTKVADAEKYEVYQQSGKKWKKIGTTSKTTLTVKKLKANKSYKFKVRAIRSDAQGAYSSVFTGKTVPLKTTLTLKAGKKALTASWKTVANITGYEVQASTSKKFTSKTTKKVTIKKAKTTKTTIKKLSKGKKYYVKVRAYKTVGSKKIYSAWSSVKTVKVK